MKKIIAASLFLCFVSVACIKKDSNSIDCSYDPCAIKAPDAEITQVQNYLSSAGITTAVKHCSGMYYEIMDPGTDKSPTVCSYVSVNYKGTLTNGTVFDQTNGTPYVNILLNLIEGWKKGVPLLKKGGKIRLYIPPSLGYGSSAQVDQSTGSVIVPANSILIFDIELLDLQ